jgi:hypothetical protein
MTRERSPADDEDRGESPREADPRPRATPASRTTRPRAGQKRSAARRTEEASGKSGFSRPELIWIPLILGCGLLITVFVFLCLVQQPSDSMGKCLQVFLALGVALLSFPITGKLAVEFQRKSPDKKVGSEFRVAGTGGFAVFLLLAVFYNPLDARPFLSQIGLIEPNPEVAKMQKALHDKRGYDAVVQGVVDGRFVKEVAKLQKENGLAVTGVVDAQTLSLLTRVEKGQVVLYRKKAAGVNADGPGGSAADDPRWQATTALVDERGQYIDSRIVPLVTVPIDHRGADKIRLGDFAVVYWPAQNKHAFAMVGDVDLKGTARFAISPAVVDDLGLPRVKPGDAAYPLVALVFVQTHERPPHVSPEAIKQKGKEVLREWSGDEDGIAKLQRLLASPDPDSSTPASSPR